MGRQAETPLSPSLRFEAQGTARPLKQGAGVPQKSPGEEDFEAT